MTTTTPFEMSTGWKNQSPEVRERFAKLKKRPVTLDVYRLCKSYDAREAGKVVALEDVTFRAYRRELLCVIGPSGCGKSTLARVIAGLDPATSGELLVGGKPVAGPGADRGMVFQGYTLFPWLTVKKNVMFGLEVAKKWTTADAEQ
jgi:NitT/TauT family transport system ATP-binding protein